MINTSIDIFSFGKFQFYNLNPFQQIYKAFSINSFLTKPPHSDSCKLVGCNLNLIIFCLVQEGEKRKVHDLAKENREDYFMDIDVSFAIFSLANLLYTCNIVKEGGKCLKFKIFEAKNL